jgi:hypothetical protein
METNSPAPTYRVWAADNMAYGPVELPVLIEWIKDERVTAHTWIFIEDKAVWLTAANVPELQGCFLPAPDTSSPTDRAGESGVTPAPAIKVGTLRRMKILADLSDEQLVVFQRHLEILRLKQFSQVVRLGEHGDAMFLVLEGELRARVLIDGKETTLATLTTGDFFGEVSLLDEGPRSADVIANQESVVLKISSSGFRRLMQEAPELAVRFLYALSRSVVGRMRLLTKRYQDSIHFSRTAASGS